MPSRGAFFVSSYLAWAVACEGASRDPEPIEYGFVAVTATGSGMNRACSGGCEWELSADSSGSFRAIDDEGTESFELSASESDALLTAVQNERFLQALEARECDGVTDGALVISATWESVGTLVDEQALGCARSSDHPYFSVLEVLLRIHAAHFPQCRAVEEGEFGRALCFIAPR